MRAKKIHTLQAFGVRAGFFLAAVIVALASLYWFLAMHRSWFSDEIVYQNDMNYQFFQHPATRWVSISKNGEKIAGFFFYPHVFSAWVLESKPYIFLVTSDTGTIQGAQGLYVYDGEKTKKVYQARTITFGSGEKSAGRLYAPWIGENIQTKKEQMHHVFSFSPEFRYLFGYESGYEGGIGFTIDLETIAPKELSLTPTGNMHWSPDVSCAINYGYAYGDSQFIEQISYRGGTLESRVLEPDFWGSDFRGVYWSDVCSGVVEVFSEYDLEGNRMPLLAYYAFSKNSDTMIRLSSFQREQYQASVVLSNRLHNVFFTTKKPTSR